MLTVFFCKKDGSLKYRRLNISCRALEWRNIGGTRITHLHMFKMGQRGWSVLKNKWNLILNFNIIPKDSTNLTRSSEKPKKWKFSSILFIVPMFYTLSTCVSILEYHIRTTITARTCWTEHVSQLRNVLQQIYFCSISVKAKLSCLTSKR